MSFPETPARSGEIRVLYVGDDSDGSRIEAAIEREHERATVGTVRPERLVDGTYDDADCLVCDHQPPDVDGLALLETVRQRAPDLPVVLFPSEGDERVASAAVAAGVDEYVPRGTDAFGRLVAAIERALTAARERSRADEAHRVATVIQDVTRAVVSAETRDELEHTVCERLGRSNQYQFVWCGRCDEDDTVDPHVVAGDDDGYLDDVTITADERATGRGPTGDALRTGEIQVSQDVREDPAFDPWRDAALERGVLATAAVPIVYEGTSYGVLALYANRPWAFDDTERELLGDLGDAMAHGIHLLETRNDLQTFRKAVEHAGHTIYITRPNGVIEYVNPRFEEMTGYDAEDAIGETPGILKSGEHDRAFYRRLWSTILSGEVWTSEIVNQRKDGTNYHVNQTIAPITDGEGNIDRFVAVNDDITAEKRQQRALERQNERLNQFTSIVSHDLRNPLNIAQGELGRAMDGDLDRLEHVETALDRMEDLIQDLLHLSKQGETIEEPSPVALNRVVQAAWQTTETTDATLDVQFDDGVTVVADRDRLVQVFENLFRNSVEHSARDDRNAQRVDDSVDSSAMESRQSTEGAAGTRAVPQVGGDGFHRGGDDTPTITVGVDDDAIFVADDGPGIPAAERDAVFDHAYTTSDGGNGLGLAIVDTIARAHGWEARAGESESGGARIEFRGVEFV